MNAGDSKDSKDDPESSLPSARDILDGNADIDLTSEPLPSITVPGKKKKKRKKKKSAADDPLVIQDTTPDQQESISGMLGTVFGDRNTASKNQKVLL